MSLRSRPALGLSLALIVLASCVGGDSPVGLAEIEPALTLSIQTSLLPKPVESSPATVNRIRAQVERLPEGTILGSTVQDVSSGAGSWEISLEVDMPEGPSQVVVSFQLIFVDENGNEVIQYSGRTEPFTLSPGESANPAAAQIVRGPADNLSVTGIEIIDVPAEMMEGDDVTVSAQVSTSDPSSSPIVFWGILEPSLASMAGTTVHGIHPGVVHIVASAGSHADTAVVTLKPRPDHVVVTPASVVVTGPGVDVAFQAQVLDQRGNVLPGEGVSWSVLTPEILEDLGGGQVRSRMAGNGVVEAVADFDAALKAQASVTVEPVGTDLAVTKTASKSSALEGEEVEFTLTVTNAGLVAVSGVSLVDTLPDGLELVGPVPDGMDFAGKVGMWSVGELAPGAEVSITLTTRILEGTAGDVLENVAWCQPGADFRDTYPPNDRASAPVEVIQPTADLRVIKTADRDSVFVGDTVTFLVVVRNQGPFDAPVVRVTEELPAGVSVIEWNRNTGTLDAGTGAWEFALPAGEQARLAVAVIVGEGTAGTTLVNVARIVEAPDILDPAPMNDESQASVTVSSAPPQRRWP